MKALIRVVIVLSLFSNILQSQSEIFKFVSSDCGTFYANETTSNGLNNFERYSCLTGSLFTFPGKEKIFKIYVASPRVLQISMTILPISPRPDLDLFLLKRNPLTDSYDCLAYSITDNRSNFDEAITISLDQGFYYVVVDAQFANVEGAFELEISCGELDCSKAIPLVCNQPYNGNTINGVNNVSIYNCAKFNKDDVPPQSLDVFNAGPEVIHSFTLSTFSNVEISLTGLNSNTDLELFILKDCNSKCLIDHSVNPEGADELIVLNNLAPGRYYVVVDGFRNHFGPYTLQVNATNCCVPQVITNNPIQNCATFTLNGSIPSNCGSLIVEKGFLYDNKPNTSINSIKISKGSGNTSFSHLFSGIPNLTYYFRAYAILSTGDIVYGEEKSLIFPLKTTLNISVGSIKNNIAPVSVNSIVSGNFINERGIIYGIARNSLTNQLRNSQMGTGSFSESIPNLVCNQNYFVAGYVKNCAGTFYSDTILFTNTNCCLSSTEILQVPLYKDIVDNKCKNLQDSSIGIYSAQYNGQLVYFAFHSNYNYFVVTDCKGEVLYATDEFPYDYKKRQDYLRGFKDVKLIDSCPGGKSLCYKPSNNCPQGVCQAIFSNGCGCDGVFYDSPCKAECAFVSYTTNSCSTPCNPDLCDKNNWLYKVVDSLLKQNYVIDILLMSGNYINIGYSKKNSNIADLPVYESTFNCQGKLLQHCGTSFGGRVCDFFMPFTQDPFPGNPFKIDTIVKSLGSWDDFKCDKLQCGSVRYGNTEIGKATFNQYLCSYNLMGGKEIIYEFDKKANQSAVFHLSEVVRDLDLFILSKNDQDFCVKHSSKDGQSFENIFLEASLPAGTYYVVVDGFNTNTSSYRLTVECDKQEGVLDCSKAKSINCNESQSGNTTLDGISMNQFYGSSSSVFYDGKEVIYKLIAPFDGVIDILLENLNTDLDLFVFDDCGNKLNPLEFSIEANKEEEAILLSVLKGKTYFIVIDSRFEMEGNFTLSITCTDCTCNNPPCVPPPPLICQDKIQLFCNDPKLGDTRTSNYQRIKQYGCGGVTKGKELLYYFELNSAQKVDIFIRNILPGNNLKLIVLDSCNPYTAKCLASGNKSNESNEAIRLNLAKGVYYIYVDGYLDKDASSFEIEIKCEKIECEKNPILVSFDTTNINCSYNIEVKPKDGVPPYTYKWSNGMTTSKLTGVPPGKYTVTVTDKKLCSKVDSVLVNSLCKPSCDTTIKGNTLFGKSNYYKYECSDHKMDGNEIIYEFDNPSTQNVVISLTDLVQDLDLFLLEYVTPMNPDRCVKSSTRTDGSYESIFVENLPKGKYYIVVEGYNKRASSFTLKIDCPKPRGFLDCANAQNVECGKTYSGNTMLGLANNNYYEGKSPVYYDGKELVYKFVAPQGIVKVNAYLEKLTSDVDFFMVENCGNFVKSTRASTESNLSNEVLIFSPVAGKTYYFVVDNPKGLEGSFNLRLKCYGTCLVGCDTINPIDCNKKIRLDCNKPLPDNNFNGTSINDSYCSGDALGKERLYYFEINTAQEVEIILNKLTKGKNLNIYLIKDCKPDGPDGSCLAIGNKSGDADDVIIKNLAAGIYYIWVDGFLETDESSYTIEVRCKEIDCSNSPMNLSFTTSKINCNYNVAVNINSGGIPPFSYKWSNGNTTAQLNNVPPGNYAVTVTDKIFCQKDTSINLPSFRTTKTVKIDSTICFGKCITFGKNTICTSGTYSETFFVAASCLDSIVTLNLTVAAPLTLPTVVSGVDCKYNLTVNPSGGKAPYRFSWQGGNSGNSRNGLAPGSYSLTVTDAVGCQKDTVFKLDPLDITITQKIDSADCGKANGRIEVVTSSKIKSAVWQDNAPNSLVRENLKPGIYKLTLTDVNGCIKTIDFVVEEKNNCTCTIYSTINPNDPDNQFFYIECWTKDCPNKPNSCLEEIELYIYNRWGNLVHKDPNYKNDWDAPGLPNGVYYYQFKRASSKTFEKGSIVVKRSN